MINSDGAFSTCSSNGGWGDDGAVALHADVVALINSSISLAEQFGISFSRPIVGLP